MEKINQKCYSKNHEEVKASCYCFDCSVYMCKNCKNLHSKLYQEHKIYNLDKGIEKIFTGFCKEKNHLDKLEYFCKTHNKLCCSGCIDKIKREGKGQHTDCDICLIEDIKDTKKDLLEKNIEILENFSKSIENSINELKNLFSKINENKDILKLNIQNIFYKMRKIINEREEEVLLEVDILYKKTYCDENIIKKIEKLPYTITSSLEKGKTTDNLWKKNKNLSLLIHDCINIENTILNINQFNKIIKNCNDKMDTIIKFYPEEENELNILLYKLKNFGELFKFNNINYNNDNNYINIGIRSINEEPNVNSIQLKTFKSENYEEYYPKDIKFEEDEFVLTFCLEGKNLNSIDTMFEIFDKSFKKNNREKNTYSLRKDNNKLFIDLIDKIDSDEFLKFLIDFNIFDFVELSIILKNNFNISNFFKMKFDEFFSFFNLVILIKGNLKNIVKLESFLKNQKEIEEKEMIESIVFKKYDNENKEKTYEYHTIENIKQLFFIFSIIYSLTNSEINFSSDKILKLLKRINKEEKLEKCLTDLKNEIISFLKEFNDNCKDILKHIKPEKISATFLIVKNKFGLSLDINLKGLTSVIDELCDKNFNINN